MKGLVGIILGIVMLLAGCGRSVDSRLALADSLIDEQADSAYMVLKGINADELPIVLSMSRLIVLIWC